MLKNFHIVQGKLDNILEPDAYLSVRLVKDYVGDNYETVESINGQTIPCVLMKDSLQIWTQINIGFPHEQYSGATSIEWMDLTDEDRGVDIKYFINEWEGDKWVRGEMSEGDTIVLHEYEGQKYHEWKVINGELIDVVDALKSEFEKEFVNIYDNIENLKESDTILQDQITNNANEIDLLKERADVLEGNVDDLEQRSDNAELRLDVIEGDEEVEGSIKNALKQAVDHADESDAELQKQINQNKLSEDTTHSLVVKPNVDGNGTSIKVNIPVTHGNIKVDENGLYFDGFMGNF